MKRAKIVLVCIMLLSSFIVIIFPVENVKASGNTLYVGGSGSGNYTNIQNAIDDANSGDTVFIFNGTYYENVIVNKTINLVGENKYDTIINGSGGIVVKVNMTAFVNISRLTLQNGSHGIYIIYSNHSRVTENNLFNNDYGVSIFSGCYNNTIVENNVYSNNLVGISVSYGCNGNIISDNNILNNNGTGIDLFYDTHNSIISGNNIFDNVGKGIFLHHDCFNSVIKDNNVSNNSNSGIYLGFGSYNSTVIENNVSKNEEGIHLYSIYLGNNNIKGNNLYLNNNGTVLEDAHLNTIIDNNISNNLVEGIRLSYSTNNIIYHNIFSNNGINAYDNLSNSWDNGYPSGGNYWSDYYGNDNYQGPNQDIPGSDDIGDIPYNITGGINQDLYPFIEQNGWINKPPYVPNDPKPTNNSKNVDINTKLSWTGGDPDCGNTVIYDIYFGTSSNPPKVIDGHWGTDYNPGVLNYNTTYHWKIVSWDNYGASTNGPIWDFTTAKINHPPNTPYNPYPQNSSTSININQDLFWNGSDPDVGDTVTYDVYFGSMLLLQKVANNISTTTYNLGVLENSLTYYWYIIAWDNHNTSTTGPVWHFTTIKPANRPPNKPNRPIGVTSGKIGNTHSYTSSTTDPDDDYVYYWFDWGDGSNSGWDGPHYSGDNVTLAHFWVSRGDFPIKVKAKDIHGNESVWSDPFIMSIPKTKIRSTIIQLIYSLLERFSFMEKILNQIISII